MANRAVTSIPMRIAPWTLREYRNTVNPILNRPRRTLTSDRSPNDTSVPEPPTRIPAFMRPTKAMKQPIPADIPHLRPTGMESNTLFLTPETETRRNNAPDITTAARAVSH